MRVGHSKETTGKSGPGARRPLLHPVDRAFGVTFCKRGHGARIAGISR